MRVGAAQFNAVVLGHRGREVVIAIGMAVDMRIGALFDQRFEDVFPFPFPEN
jgi:hypothetical protein